MNPSLNLSDNLFGDTSIPAPFVIAGPCSAESQSQLLDTAKALAKLGIKIFRAGVWKPRSRPDSFQGYGTDALKWLQLVKQETNMLIATEVATSAHIEEALRYGVDIIWIGARTTVNPFAIQKLADALKGVDIPVLVKNPINPDLDLWIGAFERLNKAGITRLAAIHRGFSNYGDTRFRNHPQWQIPIELRRRLPSLRIICDPSHIGGKRNLILDVSQTAMDLNFDGLIIESHCHPTSALSDAAQQVTPSTLKKILSQIVFRKKDLANSSDISLQLEEFRVRIDSIDFEILALIKKRMQIAQEIGALKRDHNMTILQTDRWNALLKRLLQKASDENLSHDFILDLYSAIHQESIRNQKLVIYNQ